MRLTDMTGVLRKRKKTAYVAVLHDSYGAVALISRT